MWCFMSLYKLTNKMAQLDKELAAQPSDLSSVPGIHMVAGENLLSQIVLWPLRAHHGTGACDCTYIQITVTTER